MIELGQSNPFLKNKKLSEELEVGFEGANRCASQAEFPDYKNDHPNKRWGKKANWKMGILAGQRK